MIVKMHKYSFFIFYKEYDDFLESIRQLGVLHVKEKEKTASKEYKGKLGLIKGMEDTINFLESRDIVESGIVNDDETTEIINNINVLQNMLEAFEKELEETKKSCQKAEIWGDFSPEIIRALKEENILLRFFSTSKKNYSELVKTDLPLELILDQGNLVRFMLFQRGEEDIVINAEEITLPDLPASRIKNKIEETEKAIEEVHKNLDTYAENSVSKLKKCKQEMTDSLNLENVMSNTGIEADENLMVLEGWIPDSQKVKVDFFLEEEGIVFLREKASSKDKVPILLKNNRFSKLFEPIGNMFSLPDYSELDLTIFFAPFFMMFFGFCLGDAGYGLLFVVGAGIYKLIAKQAIKPILTLIQFLGIATVIFGGISGTFFGINLIETEIQIMDEYRSLFLNPDQMFNLALVLGGLQIIFGLFIKMSNQIIQYGFAYALSTIGWLIIIVGYGLSIILKNTGIVQQVEIIQTIILALGGFLILFFSDPETNVFSRVGKGIWNIYSTVTGIFGDLLSYLRLFALGLSSAILGFVVNDIAIQILSSSKIVGPIFFVVFLLLGHTLNILISSLGSFVHPMRLTFVEFYKNAGFKGGGEKYKPFSKEI